MNNIIFKKKKSKRLKNIGFFLKKKKNKESCSNRRQKNITKKEKKTKPWTLKVALRPWSVLLVISGLCVFGSCGLCVWLRLDCVVCIDGS